MDKLYKYFLLKPPIEGDNSEFAHENKKDQTDRYDLILKHARHRGWVVDRAPQIQQGNYDISKILELIVTQFNLVFSNKTINLKIDSYQYRAEINPNEQFAIACYADRSILQLLGLRSQSIVQKTQGKRTFEFMLFDSNKYIQTRLPPSIKRISNMYVYSDIVELSPVGNSKVLIIGFRPIKKCFKKMVIKFSIPRCMSGSGKIISELLQYKFSPKLVKSFLFKTMWSPVASTFLADHFWQNL